MKWELTEYRPESYIGIKTVYPDMDTTERDLGLLRHWRSPSIMLTRDVIHAMAKSDKNAILQWLYHEIKVAEHANIKRLRYLKRQTALYDLRFVRKEPIAGYVYWIEDTDKNLIKIGCSNNPDRRLRELRNEFGAQLDIVYTIESAHMYLHEHMAHQLFSSRRVHGEWFDIQPYHMKIWNYAIKKNWLKEYV